MDEKSREIMKLHGIRIDRAPNEPKWKVHKIEPAGIELAHEIQLYPFSGFINDIWAIFGFPGGNGRDFGLPRNMSSVWPYGPRVIKGNFVKLPLYGYAQHTFNDGGEDIWIMELDKKGNLVCASDIVRNCKWRQGRFIHEGVRITFARSSYYFDDYMGIRK